MPEIPSSENLKSDDPHYVAKLDDGLAKLNELEKEALKKESDLKLNFMQDALKDAESMGLIEKIHDAESILKIDAIAEIHQKQLRYLQRDADPLDGLKFLLHGLEKIAGRVPELEELAQQIANIYKRKDEFLGLLVNLSKLEILYEKHENKQTLLYVVDGKSNVYSTMIDFIKSEHEGLSKLANEDASKLPVPNTIEEYKQKYPHINISIVSNPSKVLEENHIAKYATNKLQKDYERAHPEDMEEIKNNALHSLIDLFINSIEKTGESDFLKEFHDNTCSDCAKKDGCTIYSVLEEKYQHRHCRF